MFNPQLNVPALQQVYAQHGAISIQNILVPEYAEAIHKELLNLPWEIEIKDYAQADSFRMAGPLKPRWVTSRGPV